MMTGLENLLAMAAIRQTKARYCRLLDTRDWEGWALVFTPDAVLDVSDDVKKGMGEPEVIGRERIVGQTRDLVGQAICTHLVHEPEFTFESADRARVIWGMHDKVVFPDGVPSPIPARSVRGFGWYHEIYERHGDEWLIARLKLVRQQVVFG